MCLEQFQLQNFKFAYKNGKDFATSPWLPLPAVCAYRILVALYCFSWVIYSIIIENTWKWLIFLTDCTFLCVTAYFMCSAATSVFVWTQLTRQRVNILERTGQQIPESSSGSHDATARHSNIYRKSNTLAEQGYGACEDFHQGGFVTFNASEVECPQSWYLKVTWLLYAIAANNSILITAVFWTLLYNGYGVGELDITFHLLNSVFMLGETFLSSIPVQLLHVVYAVLYASAYCLFTVLYWFLGGRGVFGNRYIYPILDYSKPGEAVVIMVLYGFVGLPVTQLIHFGLFKLRCYLRGSQ